MNLEKIKSKGINNLFRRAETGVIYFRKSLKGREVTRSLRTKDITIAKIRALEIETEVFGSTPVSSQGKTALELFDNWVRSKETLGCRPNTLTSIRASRKYLAPYLDYIKPESITDDWWVEVYIPGVRAMSHANRKFFNDRKWLKAFLISLQSSGTIKKIPKLRNPDAPAEAGKVFSDEEIGLLLNFAQSADLHLAILMASTMGMRRLEIFALKCNRINEQSRVINLRAEDTKTKRPRSFAVPELVWPYLAERLSSGSEWVFPKKDDQTRPLHKDGFNKAWGNLKKMCGIQGRFHDLRHTFLTKAFKAPGANPALICHYAGLSLEVAEKTYLHFTEEDTRQIAQLVKYE